LLGAPHREDVIYLK